MYLAGQKLNAEDLNLAPAMSEQEADVTTTSTVYVFGSPANSQPFTAPPSRRILVQVYAHQANSTVDNDSLTSFEVREGTSQTGTPVFIGSDNSAYRTSGIANEIQAGTGKFTLVTLPTAGATYTAWIRLKVTGGTGTWYRTAITVQPTF